MIFSNLFFLIKGRFFVQTFVQVCNFLHGHFGFLTVICDKTINLTFNVGTINVGFSIPFSTLLQTIVRNEHLGKVSGIIDLIINAASLLAATLAATLAGVIQTAIIFGIVSGLILIAGIVGYFVIKALKLEDEAQEREVSMKIEREQEELKKKMQEEKVDFADKIQLTVDLIKADEMKSSHLTLD